MNPTQARIGILTNDAEKVFQANVIDGAVEAAMQAGFATEIFCVPDGVQATNALPFAPAALSGLLVIANIASDAVLHSLAATGLPMSLVSHSVADSRIPSVIPDNEKGVEQLMAHLIDDCGRRRIVFIQGHMGQNDGISRDRAFRAALIRHDLPDNAATTVTGEFQPEVAAASLAALVGTRRDFDAVVAADYLMAVAAVDVLRGVGLRVPEDVCVAGFGDGPEAEAAGVTTVAANVRELGQRACRQLLGQIQGLPVRGITVLATELIQRQTTQPRSSHHPQTAHQ